MSPIPETSTTLIGFHGVSSTFMASKAPRSPSVSRRGRPASKSKGQMIPRARATSMSWCQAR